MSDKTFNGIQFPNKTTGKARDPDSGFARLYVKNNNIYSVLPNGTDTQLTGIAETDPVFMSSAASNITNTNISNWNTAYGWGNHATQGYLTSVSLNTLTDVTITTPSNGQVLKYNGSIWVNAADSGGTGGTSVTISDTAPVSPDDGSLWWDSELGKMFIYYTDVDSGQWVEAVPSGFNVSSGSSGIALTDISVGPADDPSGEGAVEYDNTTGVFTYTPPDLSSYLTAETNDLTASVTWANVPDANITQSSVTQYQGALSITESQISDLQSYLTAETNDLTASVTWANVPDANITQSSVTQHQGALSITESQISDLGSYITLTDLSVGADATASGSGGIEYNNTTGVFTYTPPDLSSLGTSVSISDTAPVSPDDGSLWWDSELGKMFIYYTDVDSGQWVEAVPSGFNVSSGSSGIALTDISVGPADDPSGEGAVEYDNTTGVFTYTPPDLSSYLTAETNDLTASVTWTNVPDANITQSSVTQHQAALSITESQISDLGSYLTSIPAEYLTQTEGDARYLQLTGGSISGNITLSGTVDGRDVATDGTKLDGIEAGADVTDAGNVNPLVDAHLNTNTATTNQVLSWTGSDYDWVDQSGGGGSTLNDLTDVTIASVADGDLLRYNGTAGEWQNTNLGLSVTPTLSATSNQYLGGSATITNWGTYDDPAVFAQLKNSGGTVVVSNDNISVSSSGFLLFDLPATTGTYTLEVQVQDFGDLSSEVATVSITKADPNFRYYRAADFSLGASSIFIANMRFYSGAGQTGTVYPSDMTDNTTPSPYVASASWTYAPGSPTYDPFVAFDSNVSSGGWWTIGSTNGGIANEWLQIDLGSSPPTILSFRLTHSSAVYANNFKVYGSNTGSFTGEEVLIIDSKSVNQTVNVG